MRQICFIVLVLLSYAISAATISTEVENHAIQIRALYREDAWFAHILHRIDLSTPPGSPRTEDYHLFSATFPLPLSITVTLGSLTLTGSRLLLYSPLAYSAQSSAHYQTGMIRADSTPSPATQYGSALSYTGEKLTLQFAGYYAADDTDKVSINWLAMISFTEHVQLEQWSAFTTIPQEDNSDWWFRDGAYFSGIDLFTHALRLHIRPKRIHHLVCSVFLQHSAFHIPQYAFSCAAEVNWNTTENTKGESHLLLGIQSEYYINTNGTVDDDWIAARLRHIQKAGHGITLTLQGAALAYKPSYYYRRVSFNNAIPEIEISGDWDQRIPISNTKSAVRYGTNVNVSFDWRERIDQRFAFSVSPRIGFAVDTLLTLNVSATVSYEQQDGWSDLDCLARIKFNIHDQVYPEFSVNYEFSINDNRHRKLEIGGKLEWKATKHLRLYANASADLLDFSTFNDLQYRLGIRAMW